MLLSTAPFTHVFPFIRQLNYVTQGLFLQDIQSTTELQSSAQGTNEVQSQQPNAMATDAPAGDSGSLSVASNDNKKVSREDIELVSSLAYWMAYLYNDSFTLCPTSWTIHPVAGTEFDRTLSTAIHEQRRGC